MTPATNYISSVLILMLTACCCCFFSNVSYAQEEITKFKEEAASRIKTISDSLKSRKLTVAGNLAVNAGYNILPDEDNQFDYNLSANAVFQYKGIKIPFSYRFSNGRSIARFSGPSIRTPSFKAIGLSPTYKRVTLHLGNRIMDFSKYTYSNIRFTGYGLETKDEGLYIKSFRGKLKAVSPADQIFRTDAEFEYDRRAWGGLLGYKQENIEIKAILFSANDDFDRLMIPDTLTPLPKENTVVSYLAAYQLTKKFRLEAEQSLSALTRNAYDERIEISSHQTTKNMLGLFEKKASSTYYKASRAELFYDLDSNNRVSLEYETVDPNYLSLGSFYFDNNFIDYKINSRGLLLKKINYTTSIGIRNLKEKIDAANKDFKFITNTTLNYSPIEPLNLFFNYSNFKLVQNSYYRTANSSQVDTLILSQLNNTISIGGTYVFASEKPTTVSVIYSYQGTNTIQGDEVRSNNINNNLLNFTFTKSFEKHRISSTLGYIINKASSFKTTSILSSLDHAVELSEKINIQNTLSLNAIKFTDNNTLQFVFSNIIEYSISQSTALVFDFNIDFSDNDQAFGLNTLQLNLGAKMNIKPKTLLK